MSAPFGYLSLAEAADLAVRLDPAAQGRGRVIVTHAAHRGQVEFVEVIDGELVLISSAELADAQFDFGSGRMKRGGELSRPAVRQLPGGTIDLSHIAAVPAYLGN